MAANDKTPMAVGERIAMLQDTLSRVLGMISAAEGRTGLVLALDTAMLGVLAALSPRAPAWPVAPAIWSTIAAALLIVSLVFLLVSSFPRISGPRGSRVFFEGIASRSADQYRRDVAGMSLEEHADDLSAQCHRNSEIAKAKFGWLRASMVALYLAIIPWAIAIFQLYQGRQ